MKIRSSFLIGFLIVPVIAFPFMLRSVYAQNKERTLEFGQYRKYDISSEPVTIVARTVGSRPFQDEQSVFAGPDWLRELRLSFKNISGKQIKECEINIILDVHGIHGSKILVLGFPSASILDPESETRSQRLALWKPNQVIEFRLSDHQQKILDDLKKVAVPDIEIAHLAIYKIKFDDNSGWFQGIKTVEDPRRPGSMIPSPQTLPNRQEKPQTWFEFLIPLSTIWNRDNNRLFPSQAGFFWARAKIDR